MSTKRTRLSPVYLTSTERDLVRQALEQLGSHLAPHNSETIRPSSIWAKSYTRQRIEDVGKLFAEKVATGASNV